MNKSELNMLLVAKIIDRLTEKGYLNTNNHKFISPKGNKIRLRCWPVSPERAFVQ